MSISSLRILLSHILIIEAGLSPKPSGLSNLRDFLVIPNECDVRIIDTGKFHRQLSFPNLNLVATITSLPKYNYPEFFSIIYADVPVALNIFKNRFPQCRLTFILYSQRGDVSPHAAWTRAIHWKIIASDYYLYYVGIQRRYNHIFVPTTNAVITVITDKLKLLPD